MYIRNAIQKTGKNITFQVVEPSKESDCQVAFVLAYVGSPEWAARVSKGPGRLTAADLGDRPHVGMLIILLCSILTTGTIPAGAVRQLWKHVKPSAKTR